VAIITGATSGIGQATAVALAAAGADVVIVGRDGQRMEGTLEMTRAGAAGGRVAGLRLDVRDEDQMGRMAEQALEQFGRIDILVASAGLGGPGRVPKMVFQLSAEEWDEVIATNVRGVFLSNRAVLPAMIRQRGGSIINVSSSRGATRGLAFASAYCASKHAMLGFTRALACEVAPLGIRVQAILPDVTDTPLMAGAGHLCPEGMLRPGQVAEAILRMICLPGDCLLEELLLIPRRVSREGGVST
jgi:NAD(P)-dependent dehydrogenase (short-subunit alcohol dehydrogenase family)